MPSVVCIVGTRRPASLTARCLAVTSNAIAAAGVDITTFDGSEVELVFPHEPPSADARRCKTAVEQADAVVIATPEYHGTFSAMTKLFIENLGFPSALKHKPVALLGVAGGRMGAIKAIEHLRGTCSHLGAVIIPGAISVANVSSCFSDAGECIEEETEAALLRLASNTLAFMRRYRFQGEQ